MVHLQKRGIGRAPSKLILIGEHSVVYGKPAIALPFKIINSCAVITEKKGAVTFSSRFFKGELSQMPDKLKGLQQVIEKACEQMQTDVLDFHIELISTIPIGRGLGSSAAIATSLVRGLYHYFNVFLTKATLGELVNFSETFAHGTPSGIDQEAVIAGRPIYFQKGQPKEPVQINAPLYLVVADTGKIGDTHTAVRIVKEKKKRAPSFVEQSLADLHDYTKQSRAYLFNGDYEKLGAVLTKAHYTLAKLGVSDCMLDHFVKVSLKHGALGAKLTGGGRGGCMIALAKTKASAQDISQALIKAGAKETWEIDFVSEVKANESKSSRTY